MTISDPRQPTLADIAARAGTTVPTVSKVLNGRSDVSEQTRRKIMELVAETGYRRRTGPAGRSGDQRLIDLVISDVAGGWANQVLIGVEQAAADAGLDLVVTVANRDEPAGRRSPGDWVTRLLARSSAGVVLALVQPTGEQRALLTAAGVPMVLLDPIDRPPDDLASVGATNWPAGRDVAEHLLGLGHRRFGVLAWHADQLYSRARVDGFTSTVASALGDSATVDTVYVGKTRIGKAGPRQAAAQILDSPVHPTAIFACADTLALAVLEEAADRGIAVPDQLSLVGFDDLPEAHWVGLTTVRQPIAEMGSAALRLLLRLRASDRRLPREELATALVVRSTTGPVDTSTAGDAGPRSGRRRS